METLRDDVLKCLNEFIDDDKLVEQLNEIIKKEGEKVCQTILHVLTHLDLGPREAKKDWNDIISHHKKMSSAIGRNVSLRAAICDFYCLNRSLKNPKVVEIHIFEKTVKDSRYDSFTGIFNRRSFDEELSREISSAKRHGQDLSLLFFDLDDFKDINDSFGHRAGDLVLKKVVKVILKEKREEDIAARYGGEEIVLILPNTRGNNARVVGERIRKGVEDTIVKYLEKTIRLTLSGGVATYPVDAQSASGLIKCADNALYFAKGSGKNNISAFSTDNRRNLRIDFNRDIKVSELGFAESKTIKTQSKNISMGGVLFENDTPLDIGTNVQISLPIDGKPPLIIIGTIVRIESHGSSGFDIGLSISLQEIDKNVKTEISRLLKQKSNKT
jgi:diguanylate cyclase (GGDEF)-like protein